MGEGRRCQSRHRKCWVIGSGGTLWCYECGAVRPNVGPGGANWTYPVGPEGENPAVTNYRRDHPLPSSPQVEGN